MTQSDYKADRVVLPIDQVVNSQRMLLSGKYQVPGSKLGEDVWLMAYLLREGKTEEEIQKIWFPIYTTRHPYVTFGDVKNSVFKNCMSAAKKWHLAERSKIIIYKKELEAILTLDTKFDWIREYALMVLAYFKAIGGKKKENGTKFPSQLLRKMTSFRREIEGVDELFICREAGLFSTYDKGTHRKEIGDTIGKTFVEIFFLEKSGEEVFSVDSILDVPKYFKLVHKKYICPLCGKEFEKSTKSKRDICFGCWEKKRAERAEKFFDTRKKHDYLRE